MFSLKYHESICSRKKNTSKICVNACLNRGFPCSLVKFDIVALAVGMYVLMCRARQICWSAHSGCVDITSLFLVRSLRGKSLRGWGEGRHDAHLHHGSPLHSPFGFFLLWNPCRRSAKEEPERGEERSAATESSMDTPSPGTFQSFFLPPYCKGSGQEAPENRRRKDSSTLDVKSHGT